MLTLITGATGVLGKTFCKSLAVENSTLCIIGRSEEKLLILKAELIELCPALTVYYYACDLSQTESRQEFFSFCKKNDFKFDRLINVAGVDTQLAFEKYTEEKLIFQTRVNFEAAVSITRFVLSYRNEKLEILTIASICGLLPMPYFAIYSAQKGALVDFFDALRLELDKNVTITTVLPGSIPTRPDIIADIKKQGLSGKLSSKSPEFVVKTSLNALKKRKKHYTPGAYNRFVAFVQALTPKAIKMRVIAKKFKHKEKDAF